MVKRKMAARERISNELEELELLFAYFHRMGNDQLERVLEESQFGPWTHLQIIFKTPNWDKAMECFEDWLAKFANQKREFYLFQRKNYEKHAIIMADLNTLKVKLRAEKKYTALDRFLQYLFNMDDNTLEQLVAKGAPAFLETIFENKVPSESTAMKEFLKRNLREDILREWDEMDIARHRPLVPPIARETGEDEAMPAVERLPGYRYPQYLYERVKQFQNFEKAQVVNGKYKGEEEADDSAIVASSISDQSEEGWE